MNDTKIDATKQWAKFIFSREDNFRKHLILSFGLNIMRKIIQIWNFVSIICEYICKKLNSFQLKIITFIVFYFMEE